MLGAAVHCGPGAWRGSIQARMRYRATEHLLRIERAVPGGAAERAGLRAGDVITAIDGEPLTALDEAAIRTRMHGEVGTRIVLRVERDGEVRTVTIERAPAED